MRKRIYGLLAVFVAAIAIYYPYSPGGQQAINMRLARQCIPGLLPKIQADPRFADVHLSEFTGQGGSLGVFGYVPDEAARSDLRRIVLDSFPPTPVTFVVRLSFHLEETPATRPRG